MHADSSNVSDSDLSANNKFTKVSVSSSKGDNHSFHTKFTSKKINRLSDFYKVITSNHWSSITWKDGDRRRANFESARLCVLDFDDGVTLQEAHDWCRENAFFFVLATTKSHQKKKGSKPPCDRFRLILRFSEEIKCVKQYEMNMRRWAKIASSDKSCCDGARKFAPCTQVVAYEDGNSLRVELYQAPITTYDERYIRSKIIPHWAKCLLQFGCEEGQRNVSCFRLGAILTALGLPESQVLEMVLQSPINLPQEEKLNAARSGIKRAQTDGCLTA